MEEIKEVCGYQDAQGRFFATKEKLAEVIEEERKARVLREMTEKLLTSGALDNVSWRGYWEIEGILKYFLKNLDKFAQYYADYNKTKVTLTENHDSFTSIGLYAPSDATVTPPITTKNKKKWYQIF
jgi:hypothetical protein